jgi:hypothetical protein
VAEAATAQATLDRLAALQTPEGRDMTVAEVEAAAADEGLTLAQSESYASCFKPVISCKPGARRFQVDRSLYRSLAGRGWAGQQLRTQGTPQRSPYASA